jgi:hypothetical protein
MQRDGSTRYRKRPPYATPPGRRVTASARRMQRDGSTRYRKGSTRYRKGSVACNASRPCVIGGGKSCNATGRRVTARGRSHVMCRVLALSAGVSRMQHVVFMRYRLVRSRYRVGVMRRSVRALRMMRPDVVKRLLILLLMNHLHHLHLVHHFNKLLQPGSSPPALPRHTSFFLNGAG